MLRETTHKEILWVRHEGARDVLRKLDCYNLDAIISVGYRVKSHTATQFRIWATQQLREYIVSRADSSNPHMGLTNWQLSTRGSSMIPCTSSDSHERLPPTPTTKKANHKRSKRNGDRT